MALGQEAGRRQGAHGRQPNTRGSLSHRGAESGEPLSRSLKISYPDAAHRARARSLGVSPGGDIMIHGLPARQAWVGAAHRDFDWTKGSSPSPTRKSRRSGAPYRSALRFRSSHSLAARGAARVNAQLIESDDEHHWVLLDHRVTQLVIDRRRYAFRPGRSTARRTFVSRLRSSRTWPAAPPATSTLWIPNAWHRVSRSWVLAFGA